MDISLGHALNRSPANPTGGASLRRRAVFALECRWQQLDCRQDKRRVDFLQERLEGIGQPTIPSLAERAAWVVAHGEHGEYLELPRGRDTSYLTHGLFRYAGKLPPPLVSYLMHRHCVEGGKVVDPMCGGGTTLVEAVSSGHDAFGFDVNPVALLVSEAVSSKADVQALRAFGERVMSGAEPVQPPSELADYFSPDTYGLLLFGLKHAESAAEKVLMLSIARPASFANTKKINTVVDLSKTPKSGRHLLEQALKKFEHAYEQFNREATGHAVVAKGTSEKVDMPDDAADFVLLHPPYLTNTAFSELTHLQLILLGHDPKRLRQSELAYRGSYFHVTNGLRKYLVGWAKTLAEAYRYTAKGGRIAVVNGDGRIDSVRIPVGRITEEFGLDLGLTIVERAEHLLNNQTGLTLSNKMSGQHVVVFEK